MSISEVNCDELSESYFANPKNYDLFSSPTYDELESAAHENCMDEHSIDEVNESTENDLNKSLHYPPFSVETGKRKYSFKARVPAEDEDSELRKRRKKEAKETGIGRDLIIPFSHTIQVRGDDQSHLMNILTKEKCCKRIKCLRKVDQRFLASQRSKVLLMKQYERRNYLQRMLDTSTNSFYFNKNRVCSRFLDKCFGFSTDLQCSVKGTPMSRKTMRITGVGGTTVADGRERIITFLKRLSESTGDQMPDSAEHHLPFFQKGQVYDRFKTEFEQIYNSKPPSRSYFYKTWKLYVPNLKIRKVHRFTICHECESFRSALNRAGTDKRKSEDVLKAKRKHNEMVSRERQEYLRKCEQSILYPSQYMSLIVDGADQSSFGLPHFTFSTKNTKGHSLKVKLVGVLEHGSVKHLSLYTLTEEFETGANHIIEALHRTIQMKTLSYPSLPPVLYVQLDNCIRENKNSFLLAYLESLVSWGVFGEVHASFLPIGHTHTDIDQTFSCTSRRLRTNDAITMQDLMRQLQLAYTPSPVVNNMSNIINFSGLCKQDNCLKKVKRFTSFRYFKFNRTSSELSPEFATQNASDINNTTRYFRTKCCVKTNSDDDWIPLLENDSDSGFLKSVPNLHKTPPTSVVAPSNYIEVNKRLQSEETRINDPAKMQKLRHLRDQVYQSRDISFHWNLRECFELANSICRTDNTGEDYNAERDHHDRAEAFQDLEYEINTFVVVKGEQQSVILPFWLGNIRNVVRSEAGNVSKLEVHWWELRKGTSAYSGSYAPSFIQKGNSSVPWVDLVPVESVHVNFHRLSSSNKIGTRTINKIRQCLS